MSEQVEQNAQDLEQIELSIEIAMKAVNFMNALKRLEKNADFKEIIMNDFLRENVVRLVKLKAAPTFQDPEQQAYVSKQLDCIGFLDQFFRAIYVQGMTAEAALVNDQMEKEVILSEGRV